MPTTIERAARYPVYRGIQQPCRGVRCAYTGGANLLPMCVGCKLWHDKSSVTPITPVIEYAPKAMLLVCRDRVAA